MQIALYIILHVYRTYIILYNRMRPESQGKSTHAFVVLFIDAVSKETAYMKPVSKVSLYSYIFVDYLPLEEFSVALMH